MKYDGEVAQNSDEVSFRAQFGTVPGKLLDAKGQLKLSVLIPARNEASTIGSIVYGIRSNFMGKTKFVDELIVINDVSADDTANIAKDNGADVIDLFADRGTALGKGAALREGIKAADGDLLLFLDADVTNFAGHFVTSMFAPLLLEKKFMLCKPKYQRLNAGSSFGGGRVTELVAKPALELLLPELAAVEQPLAGETAIRRDLLEKISVADNYQVEIAILIDAYRLYGAEAIAQVDLGERYHKSRSLADLVPTAKDVLRAILERLA